MASVITVAFENWKAQEAASGKAVLLDEFVFANVPNLDPTKPIDRNEKLPPANQIVHRQAVNKAGLASENAVAYSVTMGADVGNFDFNWIGLLNKASGTVAMITHAPTQKKLKTQNGQQGNVLTRSFLLEFQGAAEETQIKTSAETWQIDFTSRLAGIDEMQRLVSLDIYGKASFFRAGFQVTRSGEQYTVNNGLAYVGGLRGWLSQNQIFNGLRNTKIYADFSYQGNIVSQWRTVVNVTVAPTLSNYVDSAGFTHQVFAIASIDASGNVTDLRPLSALSNQDIAAIEPRLKLELNKKVDKANISSQKGNDNDKVPSLNLLTTELGKLPTKEDLNKKFDKAGGVIDGYALANSLGVSREGSTLWLYGKNSQHPTAFLQYQDDANWSGQILIPKISAGNVVSLLHSGDITQSSGSSTTKVMSQDAATKAFQASGNYASGNSFTHTAGGSPIMLTSSGFHLRVAAAGGVDGVGSDGNVVWGVSYKGELNATITANRIKGLSSDILGGELEIPNSPAVRKRMFGISQTRKDVTASRALATTYTNTTDKPMVVDVVSSITINSIIAMIEIQVGNIVVSKSEVGGAEVSKRLSASAIVLPGEKYTVRMNNVTMVIWSEIS